MESEILFSIGVKERHIEMLMATPSKEGRGWCRETCSINIYVAEEMKSCEPAKFRLKQSRFLEEQERKQKCGCSVLVEKCRLLEILPWLLWNKFLTWEWDHKSKTGNVGQSPSRWAWEEGPQRPTVWLPVYITSLPKVCGHESRVK